MILFHYNIFSEFLGFQSNNHIKAYFVTSRFTIGTLGSLRLTIQTYISRQSKEMSSFQVLSMAGHSGLYSFIKKLGQIAI